MRGRRRASTSLVLAAVIAWLGPPSRELYAKTRIFPLPMFATTPNEGNTYGAMPVFVGVDGGEERIRSIIAPSLSWNRHARVTGTFRYYRYRQLFVSWHLLVSASTRINRSLWFQYDDNRREPGGQTTNVLVRVRRNLFYRFFGFGPDTPRENESSHTRLFGVASVRRGWNLTPDLNLGAFLEVRGNRPERYAIEGLPLTQDLYPGAPGMDGSVLVRQGVSVRLDTRERGDYSERGLATELSASLAEGIVGAGVFGELVSHTRLLVPQSSFLQLAGRFYWRQLIGNAAEIPFTDQASLGGELLLRGFPTDRFVDKGAWEVEIEERIRLFQTHIFGVVADWRIDPFLAAGQVYEDLSGDDSPWSNIRVAAGLGLRMWVRPDILGRIDLAYAGEGVRAYVMLGYPY